MADHVEDDSETPLLDSPSAHVQPPDGAISSSYVKECYSIFRKRARYYIPSLAWIPSYNVSVNLRHDIVAGVTVAFLIVPQSLSYATGLVKIPAVYGLYTCFPMIIYSLLGTSRQLAVGPEALVSILVGSSARLFATRVSIPSPPSAPDPGDGSSSSFMHSFLDTPSGLDHNNNNNNSGDGGVGGPRTEDLIAIANLLGLMVGLFTFLLGFFRLGFLDSVLSRPLLRGFVTAVAVVVCIDMGADLLRIKLPVSDEEESPISTLISILSRLSNTHALSAIISSISIAFILCCRYLKSIVAKQNSSPTTPTFLAIPKSAGTWIALFPEILFLVILSIILCWLCDWESLGVKILQSVEGGLIPPRLPPKITLVRIDSLFLSAVLISVVGFVESIVVTKTYASLHNYSVSPNRELVALGMGNILSSVFGSWPAFGSLSRSAVNESAGARTQLAGLITGGIVVLTITLLLPYFYYLPKSVCSSIIVCAAVKLIEVEDIAFIIQMRAWNDLGLLLLTFLTTVFVSIETGILLSVGISLLLVVKHTAKTRIAILGKTLIMDPHTGRIKTKFKPTHESSLRQHPQHQRQQLRNSNNRHNNRDNLDDNQHHESEDQHHVTTHTATTAGGGGGGVDGGVVNQIKRALIIRIEEGLFFGNSGSLKERIKRIEMFGELGVHPSEEPRLTLQLNRHPSNTSTGNGTDGVGSTSYSTSAAATAVVVSPISREVDETSPLLGTLSDSHDELDENDQGHDSSSLHHQDHQQIQILTHSSSSNESIRCIIFDVGSMTEIDSSATQIFKELVESYLHRSSGSLTICFVKLRPSCLPMFVRSGLWDLVGGESRFFNKIRDALEAVGLTEDGDEVGDGVGDRYSIASSYQGGGGGGTIHLINRIHRGGSASSSASSAYKNLEHSQCGQNEAHEETGSV